MTLKEPILTDIKHNIQQFIPESKVLLFGSRAKSGFENGNDVDLLIISPNEFSPREKMDIERKITQRLVNLFQLPFDILVYGKSDFEKKKNEKSLVIYHAVKEGVEI